MVRLTALCQMDNSTPDEVGWPPGLAAAHQGCKNERRYKLYSRNIHLGAQWNTLDGCIRQLYLHAGQLKKTMNLCLM